ncbi:hypothetical protein RA280_19120 [Cupriavidus sp. CV2]|nr:hypothetical protein [Cupriavidus sp. CV2]MDW3683819.1 hypothetical protein [Cupriavidus sp. CV2]
MTVVELDYEAGWQDDSIYPKADRVGREPGDYASTVSLALSVR